MIHRCIVIYLLLFMLTSSFYRLRDASTSLTLKDCTLYLCVSYLSENKQRLVSHLKLIGIYNRVEKCLLRGTNWVFKRYEPGL